MVQRLPCVQGTRVRGWRSGGVGGEAELGACATAIEPVCQQLRRDKAETINECFKKANLEACPSANHWGKCGSNSK